MKKFHVYTTLEEFESMHKSIDSHRANAKEVKVPRQALLNLLMDHSRMLKELDV